MKQVCFEVPNRIPHSAFRTPHSNAFTLIELLVVIAIIGILAAIGLPAMRGMTQSHATIAANRQFIDDLALARQTAIADHTSVYVIFVPTNIATITPRPPANQPVYTQFTNLYTAAYTTYALMSLRQVGEQPGRATPKYITGWRSLPNGVFFPLTNFFLGTTSSNRFHYVLNLPFPVATNYVPGVQFPCIAFNYLGQLFEPEFGPPYGPDTDKYISLARGSIFFDPATAAPDVQENPPLNSVNNYNIVYINALTGRAKILQPQIQ